MNRIRMFLMRNKIRLFLFSVWGTMVLTILVDRVLPPGAPRPLNAATTPQGSAEVSSPTGTGQIEELTPISDASFAELAGSWEVLEYWNSGYCWVSRARHQRQGVQDRYGVAIERDSIRFDLEKSSTRGAMRQIFLKGKNVVSASNSGRGGSCSLSGTRTVQERVRFSGSGLSLSIRSQMRFVPGVLIEEPTCGMVRSCMFSGWRRASPLRAGSSPTSFPPDHAI